MSCDANGDVLISLDETAGANWDSLSFMFDGRISLTNAADLVFDGFDTAVLLSGASINYFGNGNSIVSLNGTAISGYAMGEGASSFTLGDTIAAVTGVRIGSGGGQPLSLIVDGGAAITATVGLDIAQWSDAPVTIELTHGSFIDAPIPVQVLNGGITQLSLAGTLRGEGSYSMLGNGDSVLELQPGYQLDGVIDGQGGENLLVWGGVGTAEFDLEELGTKYVGFQHFQKSGSSVWRLSAPEAVLAWDAPFDIDLIEGTLDIAGRLPAGTVSVKSAGRLSGTGHLDTLDIFGTLAPGHSVGSIWAGDVTFHAGSMLEIEAGAAGVDILHVSSANLDAAALKIVPTGGAVVGQAFLLSDTALLPSDRFASVTSASLRYRPELVYETDRVLLNLSPTGAAFASYARSPAQAAVAALLDAMGSAAPYYDQLDKMDVDAASALLEQLAGTDLLAASDAMLQSASTLSTAALGRIQQQSGTLAPSTPAFGYTSFTTGDWTDTLQPSVWGRLVATTSSMGGMHSGSVGMIGGADVELGNDWTAGALMGIGGSSIASGTATTTATNLQVGLYGAKQFGGLSLRFGGNLGYHAIDSSRRLTAPGVNETLTSAYGVMTAQAFAEIAQNFALGPVDVELFGDLGYARSFTPAYSEAGGAGALTVAATSTDAYETALGLRAGHKLALGTVLLTAGGSLAWKHRANSAPATSFAFAGSAPFAVPGTSAGGSSLAATLDLHLDLAPRSNLDLTYGLDWAASGMTQAISARYARML